MCQLRKGRKNQKDYVIIVSSNLIRMSDNLLLFLLILNVQRRIRKNQYFLCVMITRNIMADNSNFRGCWMSEISRWYFCGTQSFAHLTTTPANRASCGQKKTFNLDAIKKNAKFLNNSWIVTVYDNLHIQFTYIFDWLTDLQQKPSNQ